MAELLLELFSEELPAGVQAQAAVDYRRLLVARLDEAALLFQTIQTFVTPRRLTAVVTGLPRRQPDVRVERKGPRIDAPPVAIQGFLRAVGLESLDQCQRCETAKGPIWVALFDRAGQETAALLPALIQSLVDAMPWPKSMRFGAETLRWSRPLRRVNVVFDGAALPGALATGAAPLPFGCESEGHRFLAPAPFRFHDFASYNAALRARYVILAPEARRDRIAAQLRQCAAAQGLTVRDDPTLLEEVTGLVEWPVTLIGRIDPQFMTLPPDVLTTSMRTHQKYFSLLDDTGAPAPFFAVVANTEAADGGCSIIAGNERVLRARLADACFFWDQDRSVPLTEAAVKLQAVAFHARLGSVAARVERLMRLADRLRRWIPGASEMATRRAAQLSKADLTTRMVAEFPELQGVMGRYYALAQGEAPDVADAIAGHYAPAGPKETCPTAPVTVAVALAEKIDTLCTFWLIDEKPTGSRDPFALRRAALGTIRLILENCLRLPLLMVFAAHAALSRRDATLTETAVSDDALARSLMGFLIERLKTHLRSEGVAHDRLQAALGDDDDLTRAVARLRALEAFLETEAGADLLITWRRVANILAATAIEDATTQSVAAADSVGTLRPEVAGQAEETALAAALEAVESDVAQALLIEDVTAALVALATLRPPVDAFFAQAVIDHPMPAVRAARLQLLGRSRRAMRQIADFGALEG